MKTSGALFCAIAFHYTDRKFIRVDVTQVFHAESFLVYDEVDCRKKVSFFIYVGFF